MNNKIEILQIGLDSHLGGIETYLLKIATYLNTDKYSFSFLAYKGTKPCFQDQLEKLGYKFYFITSRNVCYATYIKELNTLLSTKHFDIIHCNMNSMSNFEPILLCTKKRMNVLVHSRNGSNVGSLKTRILDYIGKRLIPYKKVTCAAVSDLAGEWMFKNKDFTVLNNGLDVEKYKYNPKVREKIRSELEIGSREMILHIGAFRRQKNHIQLIDIFNAYHLKHPDSILVLVGEGELKQRIVVKVQEYGLSKNVIFTGIRNDVPDILSAADKFLFPSLYEGFPNVLIEAETSGLSCVVADTITKQTNIANLCQYVPLDAPIQAWIRALEKKYTIKREDGPNLVRAYGLDIEGEMKRLYAIYDKCLKRE